MLKSQVSVALCAVMLCVAATAVAHPGFSGSGASGSAPASVTTNLTPVAHATYAVSFAVPGRQMKKFVASYLKENDDELAMVRDRSQRPFTIIDSVMGVYELPGELRYLAVIESELRATAVSRVGARGPWQLMAVTARDLGLKVSRRSDERTNYYKSTRAAALYLRDLHREFKDWLLVLAAYNAGPVPVIRAIRMAHSRNFWALERYLPAETRQHVKRFIATAYYFAISQRAEESMPEAPVCRQNSPNTWYAGVQRLPEGTGATGCASDFASMWNMPVGRVGVGMLAGYQVPEDAAQKPEGILSAALGRKEFVGFPGARGALAVAVL